MHLLKLEPFSGISGDMFLGALAPLLQAEDEIASLPKRLGLATVSVSFDHVIRSTLQCRKAHVHLAHSHDHDHPHSHDHDHDHDHDHHHHHGHDHLHTHTHTHAHGHAHRAYTEIVALIQKADLPDTVKKIALDMFRLLGEAEAEMHGMPLDDVHFHEVGGEDAIVDLVGAAWLIDKLSPLQVYCTPVCTGFGSVRTAHGHLPVPAPATQKLLQGMPTFAGPVEKEMTTPTGAVILRILQPNFTLPVLQVTQSQLGAGTRELPSQPNALRASLCQPQPSSQLPAQHEAVTLLQTNLDNLPAEDLGADLLESLLQQGALDAWLTPILMKKGRPAQKLEVLCPPQSAGDISTWILKHLPTLGVRHFDGHRQILGRSSAEVDTPFGKLHLKQHHLPDGTLRNVPESAACQAAARQYGVSVQEVRQAAITAAALPAERRFPA